jgi:hypothetical protein
VIFEPFLENDPAGSGDIAQVAEQSIAAEFLVGRGIKIKALILVVSPCRST